MVVRDNACKHGNAVQATARLPTKSAASSAPLTMTHPLRPSPRPHSPSCGSPVALVEDVLVSGSILWVWTNCVSDRAVHTAKQLLAEKKQGFTGLLPPLTSSSPAKRPGTGWGRPEPY